MRSASTDKNNITAYARQFITSALLASGFIQIAAPIVLAAEPAGTKIENTANASYEDPNDPGKPLNTISNTVIVEVAEVAGITITPGAVTGGTGPGGALAPGDTAYFGFTVTNVGNDTTNFSLPGTANTLGPVNFQTIEYLDPATNAWTPIPAGGASNQLITKAGGVGFAPNESLQVRVKATVAAGANGDVSVFLGNTPGTGLTPPQADQNIAYTPSGGDVFTVDSEGKAGDVTGSPSNGIREASNFLKATIGVAPKPIQAFATLLKNSTYAQNGTPTNITDDKIDYNLTLKVAQTSPNDTKDAGDLAPAPITLDGNVNARKVLVSDAVPVGTIVESASAPVGSGWTVVYTTDPTTILATAATWKTGPLPTTGVTRIGFIADGPILKGTVQPDLKMTVKIDPTGTIATSGSGTVANIAQVFGNTVDPSTGLPSADATKKVYDESGDQNPNNYDGAIAPTTNTPTNGVGDATDPDLGNNNSGTTPGGETNVVSVTKTPAPGVLNGPAGSPTAIATTNNDDFTNKSAAIDPVQAKTLQFNLDGTPKAGTGLVDPPAVSFGNTVQNTGAASSTITLLPNGNPVQPDGSKLPDGTKVTITNPAGQSATYTLAGTTWTTTATSPVTITVAPGTTGNYSTQVDLPLSDQLKGYGVPIVAFIDDATPGYQGTEPSNTTIDRVYTGYLKLKKEARILSGANGAEKQTWTTDNTLLKIALPTDKIEYRISYENISSSAPAGSNSVQLNARNVSINEDGAAVPNNWATTTTHLPGAVYKESNATVTYTPVNSDADLTTTKYTYQVTSDLTPGQIGKFQFTRVVK